MQLKQPAGSMDELRLTSGGPASPILFTPLSEHQSHSLGKHTIVLSLVPCSPEYGKQKSSRAPYRPSVALHLMRSSPTTELSQVGQECGGPQRVSLRKLRLPDM